MAQVVLRSFVYQMKRNAIEFMLPNRAALAPAVLEIRYLSLSLSLSLSNSISFTLVPGPHFDTFPQWPESLEIAEISLRIYILVLASKSSFLEP